MGKALLIMVLGSFVIFGVLNLNVNRGLNFATQTSVDYYSETQARNICNSMAEILFSELADNPSLRVSTAASKPLLGGTASYTVTDEYFAGDSLIKLAISSSYNNISKNITVYGKSNSGYIGFVPVPIKAAASTNNSVETSGTLIIDGRNHDLNGNVIPGSGTYAIWTTSVYRRSGNSKIGGTFSSTDYEPANPGNDNIKAENQAYTGGYPDSPDKVFGGESNGYPEGTLKAFAQSGISGSQYLTDPNNLNYPLKGITYVELPSGGTWQGMSIDGSGVLIVHNSSLNAIMKNLNSGTFKGLIIADDVVHINTSIIGALVALTPNPSSGNCIGNGNGKILFSDEAIKSGTSITNASAGNSNFGFGKKRLTVSHWLE